MDCNAIEELMSLSIDGMLSDDEQKQLNTHLESCSECREIYALYQSVQATLADEEPASLPENFHNDLMARINEEKVVPLKRRFHYKQWNIAAAVVILVVFGLVGYNNMDLYRWANNERSASVVELASEETTETATMTAEAPAIEESEMEMAEEAVMFDVAMEESQEVTDMAEPSVAGVASESKMANDDTMIMMEAADESAELEVVTTAETEQITLNFSESTDGGAGAGADNTIESKQVIAPGKAENNYVVFKSSDSPEMDTEDNNDEHSEQANFPYKTLALLGGVVVILGGFIGLIIRLVRSN